MNGTVKEILFEEEARTAIGDGIEQLADLVAITLGPKGRNVAIESWGSPSITSDGNSIVKELELKNTHQNVGVAMGKEIASKIKEKVGDGTTTGIVLLRALVQGGIKNITSGTNPIFIKRGMEKALEKLLHLIDRAAIQIQGKKDTQNVATVSASGHTEVGEIIAESFEKVGPSGIITIEEGKSTETILELVEGMQLDRGYLSAYFCTNAEKMIVDMTNPLVLITDKKITSVQEILALLQHAAFVGKELLIVAEDIEGDALSTLVMNKLKGTLKVAAIKAPGFGDRKKALLEDLAVLTGAEVVSEEKGLLLKDATSDVLGSANQIIVTKDKTTLIGGKGSHQAIQERIAQLEQEIEHTSSKYDIEKLEERKAKLRGKVVVLKIGAPTEPEMKKKKQLFEDSLNSTRSALEEGIVPGGGVALLRAARACQTEDFSKEEQIGANILFRACEAPFRQIVQNTGFDPSVVLEDVLKHTDSFGFNALTEQVENLLEAGVMDPVKVVKNSLAHAVSGAGVILLSEAILIDAKE